MKTWLKYSLVATTAALLCAGSVFLHRSYKENKSHAVCNGVSVHINGDCQFVTENDVRQYISGVCGNVKGQKLDSIRLFRIEEILDSKSAVLKSQVWYTDDGTLQIEVEQRKPAARFVKEGGGFYVDDRGCIFPLHSSYTADVPVVSGAIPVRVSPGYKGKAPVAEEQKWIEDMLSLLDYMDRNRKWRNRFTTIRVASDGDIVMHSDGSKEKIIFGRPDGFEAKFSRIEDYYSRIAPAWEDGYYSTVNVKYDGQISCRK